MLEGDYEHVVGGFVSLFTGAWSSVEVICRASLEASTNVLYVLDDNTPNRLSQYVSHYFVEGSKSIERYEQLVTRENIKGGSDWATTPRNILQTPHNYIKAVFNHKLI